MWVEFQVGRSLSLCWQAKLSSIFTLTCSVHESPWSLAFLYVNSESSPGTPSPAQFSPPQRITSGDNLRWSLNCTAQTPASLQIHLCLGIHLWGQNHSFSPFTLSIICIWGLQKAVSNKFKFIYYPNCRLIFDMQARHRHWSLIFSKSFCFPGVWLLQFKSQIT